MPTTDGGEAVPYTIVYLDTCQPGFFAGFSGHTYAVSLPKRPRTGEVRDGLLREITHTEVFPDTRSERVYDELRCSAVSIFQGLDRRVAWSKQADDLSESYAYFGIIEGNTL
jgi:hypothetical protein